MLQQESEITVYLSHAENQPTLHNEGLEGVTLTSSTKS